MTVLVVGVSHRSAAVALLERLAVDAGGASKLAVAALETPHVSEALVLATCNRVEIYAAVDRFHGSVEDLTALLVDASGLVAEAVLPSVYVHYDDAAVRHVFTVATGLDSMVVGEPQILGQLKEALNRGQRDETVGAALNSLFQQGLRVGKRAHAETGIDRAGQSLVSVALNAARGVLGTLADTRVCIVGAGSMASLAAAALRREQVGDLVISSRTSSRAQQLASGAGGRATGLADLDGYLHDADLVISCTGASGVVVTAQQVAVAATARRRTRPLVLIDLALPHDIEPAAGDIAGVSLIDLGTLADSAPQHVTSADETAVSALIAEEVAAFAAARTAASVAPTVIALRTMATGVVASELDRLWARCDGLTTEQRSEISATVGRVADKLLHEPTVRIKQLADQSPSASYADALAELFALDPATVRAVTGRGDLP